MKPQKFRSTKTRSNKKIWIRLLIAGGIIGGMWLTAAGEAWLNSSSAKLTKEQAAMTQYLEEKYHKEFIVTKPRLQGAGLGVDGSWQTTAYPAEDAALVFDIDASQRLTSFSDQYVAAIWSREQTEKIQPKVDELYGKRSRTNVAIKIIFSGDLIKDATLNSPTYEEARGKYANRGFYYKIVIATWNEQDTAQEAARAYQLIEFARHNNIQKPGLFYKVDRIGPTWFCSLEPDRITAMTNATGIKTCIDDKRELEE